MEIIYEDGSILIVSKAAGQVVNRAKTVKGRTLQEELEEYLSKQLEPPRGNPPGSNSKTRRVKELAEGSCADFYRRAGIVHRLDKDTSGVLVVAKTEEAFSKLQAQFKKRTVKKEYLALVHGKVKAKEGVVEAPLARNPKKPMRFAVVKGGRKAETGYEVTSRMSHVTCNKPRGDPAACLPARQGKTPRINPASEGLPRPGLGNSDESFSLLRLKPSTGRTHQIRVHMKHIGHPIVSDPFYLSQKMLKADRQWCPRLFLHAESLGFKHPKTGAWVRFEAELPQDLRKALDSLSPL